MKALFKAPEFRYQTVNDFLSAVQKACPPPAAIKPATQTVLEGATIIEQSPVYETPVKVQPCSNAAGRRTTGWYTLDGGASAG